MSFIGVSLSELTLTPDVITVFRIVEPESSLLLVETETPNSSENVATSLYPAAKSSPRRRPHRPLPRYRRHCYFVALSHSSASILRSLEIETANQTFFYVPRWVLRYFCVECFISSVVATASSFFNYSNLHFPARCHYLRDTMTFPKEALRQTKGTPLKQCFVIKP